MKRNHLVIVTVVCVMLWSLNSFQGAQVQPFDLRKCQQELEIMKGILRTTLGFASQELAAGLKSDKVETKPGAKRFAFGRSGDFNIGAFYLAGQGAVFTIPTSSVRDMMRARQGNGVFALAGSDLVKEMGLNGEWMEQLGNQLNELNAQLKDNFGFDALCGVGCCASASVTTGAACPGSLSSCSGACPETSPRRRRMCRKRLQPEKNNSGRSLQSSKNG